MPQIGAEVAGFLLAVIAGGVARLLYQSLVWMGTAVYFFVQIYHTSSGGIRWSFLLGCVGGAAFASFLIKKIEKIGKKIYMRKQNKFSENLAGKKKRS